jgi:D-threo-aldose 1-dehydrogenase
MKIFPDGQRVGLGGAPLGNLLGEVSEADAVATVNAAWDEGWRYFDTAPHYGLGLAEERLGVGLRGKPRDEFVLSSKVGRIIYEADGVATDDEGFEINTNRRRRWDFSRDGVLQSIEDSLRRIGTDRLDVVFVHDPDDHYDEAVDGAFRALARLREEGLVRAIGVGMNQTELLCRFAREADPDCFLVAGRYTLLDRSAADELLPLCDERGIAVIAGGVFNSGVLADGTTYDYAPASPAVLERAAEFRAICARRDVPRAAAAVQVPLRHPAVACVLVGCRSAAEVEEDARLADLELPQALWQELA